MRAFMSFLIGCMTAAIVLSMAASTGHVYPSSRVFLIVMSFVGVWWLRHGRHHSRPQPLADVPPAPRSIVANLFKVGFVVFLVWVVWVMSIILILATNG